MAKLLEDLDLGIKINGKRIKKITYFQKNRRFLKVLCCSNRAL